MFSPVSNRAHCSCGEKAQRGVRKVQPIVYLDLYIMVMIMMMMVMMIMMVMMVYTCEYVTPGGSCPILSGCCPDVITLATASPDHFDNYLDNRSYILIVMIMMILVVVINYH